MILNILLHQIVRGTSHFRFSSSDSDVCFNIFHCVNCFFTSIAYIKIERERDKIAEKCQVIHRSFVTPFEIKKLHLIISCKHESAVYNMLIRSLFISVFRKTFIIQIKRQKYFGTKTLLIEALAIDSCDVVNFSLCGHSKMKSY